MKHVNRWVQSIRRYNVSMSVPQGFFGQFIEHYAQMLDCPDPLSLAAFALNQLPAEQERKLQAHLTDCQACQTALNHLNKTAATGQIPYDFNQDASLAAELDQTPATPQALAPGQIWSTYAQFDLKAHGLPVGQQALVEADFSRLFVITALGPKHLGRFQEVTLCPLSEQTELSSEQDLLIAAADNPFDETLMLESWNPQQALSLQLEHYHGQLSAKILADLDALQQAKPNSARRGGKIISERGPHARFQELERQQNAYLAKPLQALHELERLSRSYLLQISPKGLTQPQSQISPSVLFPQRQGRQQDRILAAASSTLEREQTADNKETLLLNQDLCLDLWLEGQNLEFYSYTSEHQPVSGLLIDFTDAQGYLQTLVSDQLGTAFLPLATLLEGASLLGFRYPSQDLALLYPVHRQPDQQ